jgi:hypothetical protein
LDDVWPIRVTLESLTCVEEKRMRLHEPTRIALFQLTSALSYPNLEGAGSLHYSVEPSPRAAARRIWCQQFQTNDHDSSDNPIRSYGGSGLGQDCTIYHPTAVTNRNGYAIGLPSFAVGDRVFCTWNGQSSRWEILAPPLDLWRFELKTSLSPGGSATAYLLSYSEGYGENGHIEFTVYDAVNGTLRGRGRTETAEGFHGYAKLMPDSQRWEVIALEHPARWIRFALSAAMSNQDGSASAGVLNYWDGSNPDLTSAGVTVVNCAINGGGYRFAGAAGAVGLGCFDPASDLYHIVQMENA